MICEKQFSDFWKQRIGLKAYLQRTSLKGISSPAYKDEVEEKINFLHLYFACTQVCSDIHIRT